MTIKPIKISTRPTLQEFSRELEKFAMIEGEDHLIYQSSLETINELIAPTLLLLNIYKDFSLFPKLAELNIDTIVIESTFTYQDKIQKVMIGLLTLYKQTGWKPKRIINTMDYGLDKLFMLGKLLDIETYHLTVHNFKDEPEDSVIYLDKIEYDEDGYLDLQVQNYSFSDFLDETLEELGLKEVKNPKKEFILKDDEHSNAFLVRNAMIKYFETLGVKSGDNGDNFIEITKKEVYEAVGMNKPTSAFNNAWIALYRHEYISYDKESKKWIWL